MATYMELRLLFGDGELLNRIEVACIVAAETIRVEDGDTTNHSSRLGWAEAAFTNPNAIRERMLKALLAANKDQDVATIRAVTDVALQSLVDGTIDLFADGS